MVSTKPSLSLEEFLSLPEGDVGYELMHGQAVPKMSPKAFHSAVQSALLVLIRAWCRDKGRIYPEWAILLKRAGEDWVPLPDLTYISYDRLPKDWKRNEACPALPEWVIEIISPGQTLKELEAKAQDYFAAGIPRVWVVEPETQVIWIYLPEGSSHCYSDQQVIEDDITPGLVLTPRQVFEEAGLV